MTKQPNGDFHADYVETYVVGAAVAEVHQRLAVFLPDPTDFPPPVEGSPVLQRPLTGRSSLSALRRSSLIGN